MPAVFLAVLLSSSLLSGCLVRFMYDWLDVYAAWKIDDYFDITRSQKSSLYSELDTIIAWHRKSELSKYSAFLREISAAAEKPLRGAGGGFPGSGVRDVKGSPAAFGPVDEPSRGRAYR